MSFEQELIIGIEAVRKACLLCVSAQTNLANDEKREKEDKSPVTVADYGAQAVVFHELAAAFPEDLAVGEEDAVDLESPDCSELLAKVVALAQSVQPDMSRESVVSSIDRGDHNGGNSSRFWTLDPIDGTKGFLRGDQYAIALALIENGEVVLGILGCPNLPCDPKGNSDEKGCILYASRGLGAFQISVERQGEPEPIRVDSISDPARASFCESVESGHTAHSRSAKIVESLGNTARPFRMDSQCKYAAVSRGQASIYLRLPTRPGYEERIWDHAAGVAILQEAGGKVTDTNGDPLDFSLGRTLRNNKGIVASSPLIFDPVVKAVIESAQ